MIPVLLWLLQKSMRTGRFPQSGGLWEEGQEAFSLCLQGPARPGISVPQRTHESRPHDVVKPLPGHLCALCNLNVPCSSSYKVLKESIPLPICSSIPPCIHPPIYTCTHSPIIHPPTNPSTYHPSIHPSTHHISSSIIHLSIHPLSHPFTHPSTHHPSIFIHSSSNHLSNQPSIHPLSIHLPSIYYPSIQPPPIIHSSIHLSIFPSIYLSIHPYIHSFFLPLH